MPVFGSILGLPLGAFTLWMLVDCLSNRREGYWFWVIMAFPVIGPVAYFFTFKWEDLRLENVFFMGRRNRAMIEEIKARCHLLDQAVNWEELGDAYWHLGYAAEAEQAYREALRRDPKREDASSRLGFALLQQEKTEEAWPLIEATLQRNRGYDQDDILWKAAQCQSSRGNLEEAKALYEEFLTKHSYYETQSEYADLLARMDRFDEAAKVCQEIIYDLKNSSKYIRRRNSRWNAAAKKILKAVQLAKKEASVGLGR